MVYRIVFPFVVIHLKKKKNRSILLMQNVDQSTISFSSRQTFHRLINRRDKFLDIHIVSEGKGEDRPSIEILESETTEISFASRHSKHVSVV